MADLAAGELDGARHALQRAINEGALGSGYAASLEGDAVVFDGGVRAFGPSRGRIVLSSDGRASYELRVGTAEAGRVGQAVLGATLVSVLATLAFHLLPTQALPLGGVVGVVWAWSGIARDRQRWRRRIHALVADLPRLLKG